MTDDYSSYFLTGAGTTGADLTGAFSNTEPPLTREAWTARVIEVAIKIAPNTQVILARRVIAPHLGPAPAGRRNCPASADNPGDAASSALGGRSTPPSKRRAQTHIFLCVLAYHLLAAMEKRFLNRGIHTPWWNLRQQLSTHQVITIVLPTASGRVLKIRKGTTPEPVHRDIYATLKIPTEVMKPVKTWH